MLSLERNIVDEAEIAIETSDVMEWSFSLLSFNFFPEEFESLRSVAKRFKAINDKFSQSKQVYSGSQEKVGLGRATKIDDEIQYVIDRSSQAQFIGSTLQKPRLLLKKNFVKQCNHNSEKLKSRHHMGKSRREDAGSVSCFSRSASGSSGSSSESLSDSGSPVEMKSRRRTLADKSKDFLRKKDFSKKRRSKNTKGLRDLERERSCSSKREKIFTNRSRSRSRSRPRSITRMPLAKYIQPE